MSFFGIISAILSNPPGGGGGDPDPPPTGDQLSSTTINDNDRYTAFPAASSRSGVPFMVSKDSTDHASAGPAMMNFFTSGAWTVKTQMKIDGVLQSIATLGVGVNGTRVFFAYQPDYDPMDPYPYVKYAYCDDGTRNFISAGQVNKRTGETFVSGFGKIIKMPSGKLRYPVYASDGTYAYLYFHESVDNGVSWAVGSDIYTSTIDVTGKTITEIIDEGRGSLSELYVQVVEAGVSDATTKMVCCVRNDSLFNGGAHFLFSSDDGGGTWTLHGLVTSERIGSDGGNPMTVHIRGSNIYFVAGQREATTNGGLGYNFNICVLKGIALDAYNDPTQLSAKRFLYKGIAGYKANGADFGYPEIFDKDSEDWIALYDHSTKSQGGGDSIKRIRIVIIPLEPPAYLELIRTTNQSISTATSTALDTPVVQLDSQGMYLAGNITVKGGQVGIPAMRVKWDNTNSTGTYRQARIKCGTKYDCYLAIPPSASARFSVIDLVGIPFNFANGDTIEFLVEHDATGSVNVLNTGLMDRAMITYNKVNEVII